jgi:hypothetical protein
MELLEAFLDKHGMFRRSPKGTVWNAAVFLNKVESAFERTHTAMLEQQREAGADPGQRLADIEREIAARPELTPGADQDGHRVADEPTKGGE